MGLQSSKTAKAESPASTPNPPVIKVILLGESGTGGKTNLLLRYVDGVYKDGFLSTIGVDFRFKMVNINNSTVKLQIWDTAGQERFRTITTSYFHNSHGAIIGWDITDRSSFKTIRMWVHLWRTHCDPAHVDNIVLIGNKCDAGEHRAVTFAEGEALARECGCEFFETSAKENINVDEVFAHISTKVWNKQVWNNQEEIMLK